MKKIAIGVLSVAACLVLAVWFARYADCGPALRVIGMGSCFGMITGIPFILAGWLPKSAFESSITQG